MKRIEFDLKKALAGEPVIHYCGQEVDYIYDTGIDIPTPVIVKFKNSNDFHQYNRKGEFFPGDSDNTHDLYMKPKTITVNGFEVPEPESEKPDHGQVYFVADPLETKLFRSKKWLGIRFDYKALRRGLIHLDKESAIAHSNAMMGIDPNQEASSNDK